MYWKRLLFCNGFLFKERNYRIAWKGHNGEGRNKFLYQFYISKMNLYVTKDFAGKFVIIMVYYKLNIYNLQQK